MEKIIHIVCLQVPYPPDYGGVVDLFWKLKYLHAQGITIHLHCFEYGTGEQPDLLQYCATVRYYKRTGGIAAIRWNVPYIVSSRINKTLQHVLLQDSHPVLLEGIHCTWLLHKGVLKDRRVILRLHNMEWDYYRQLGKTTRSVFRRWYYRLESFLLKKYESAVIKKAGINLCVSLKDTRYLQQEQMTNVQYLPVFLPWNDVISKEGRGDYCLYHGNLGVAENEKAATWLVEHVFCQMHDVNVIIAGKNPSFRLNKLISKHDHIRLVQNPSFEDMETLIREAHVHVLPSFTDSGIKLKLLHALFCGRFCITNTKMVQETGLEDACIIADTPGEFIHQVQKYLETSFSSKDVEKRKLLRSSGFNNIANAQRLAELI